MNQAQGQVTKITQDRDATLVEVTMSGRKPMVWTVPDILFAPLDCTVGRKNNKFGNLRGVSQPEDKFRPVSCS